MGSEEKIAAARDEWVRKTIGPNIGACQSPMEELLLLAFLNHEWTMKPGTDVEDSNVCIAFRYTIEGPRYFVGWWYCQESNHAVYLFQQTHVPARGKAYKADFAAYVTEWRPEHHGYIESVFMKCVIEVDGHDFHERTKKQASHDKARDRAMAKDGWHVLRFTGSDVYADADACVDEVIDFIESKVSEGAK